MHLGEKKDDRTLRREKIGEFFIFYFLLTRINATEKRGTLNGVFHWGIKAAMYSLHC